MTWPAILADPDLAPILDALPRARLVGGCVRDTLAGCAVADIDLATPDPPDDILAALAAAGLRAIPTGLAHGTITAISGGRAFEITTLRRDEETDGRHARVAWTGDFQQDAARRDFTINAMSLERTGALHDYFGGAEDLQLRRVRFVGAAVLRVEEDALRILRFFRFYARYGAPPPDPEAAAAIAAACRPPATALSRLSGERVWMECKRILQIPDPGAALTLMRDWGVLAACLPGAANLPALLRLIEAGAPADPLLRLAALLGASADGVADRLKLSGGERARLIALGQAPVPAPQADDAALRRLLADEPADILIGRSWLAGDGSPPWQALARRLAEMQRPIFPLEGRHALALGAVPGPPVGKALRGVRDWWLAGGCSASEAEAVDRLRAELAGSSGQIVAGG